ncbi:MAG: hypothetical protein LW713_01720 [Acetobacteraceae bacterium]|nr:hypothetical protein [Acetobacteraceae bacterium]
MAKAEERGDDGRFKARDTAPEPAPETPDQPETAKAAEPQAEAIEPPSSWSAEVKAKWATLPPDVQRYVLDRESQTHKAITEKGQRASLYDAIEQAIGENKTALVAEYGDIPRAVQMLVNVSTQAGRDPLRFIEWFAGQRGIDLRAHFAGQAGQPAAPVDPMQNALMSEVTQLKQQIELQSTISQFEQAKDASGKPLRPHFADVRLDMGRLIASGAAQGLEDAYTKAVRINDAVWAKVQAAEEAERAAKAKADAAAKAADAKKAASINMRSRGAVSGSPGKPQDIRSSLEAAYRQIQG